MRVKEFLLLLVLVLSLLPPCAAFVQPSAVQLRGNKTLPPATKLMRKKALQPLQIDLFGLGPSEVVVVVAAAALLYGPDRIKGQLRDSGVENDFVKGKGLRAERVERVESMTKLAEGRRKKRTWNRINAAIVDGDEDTLSALDAFNSSD